MRDYLESGEAEYDEQHVVECEAILTNHATAMQDAGDGRAALVNAENEDVTEAWREW